MIIAQGFNLGWGSKNRSPVPNGTDETVHPPKLFPQMSFGAIGSVSFEERQKFLVRFGVRLAIWREIIENLSP